MQNYKQPGETVTLTAPAGGVSSGDGVKIGQLFVVAANDAAAGEEFEGATVGVFELPKNATQALTEGALVYWDAAAGNVTTTATANLLIGAAVAAAGAADTEGEIRLNGIARVDG